MLFISKGTNRFIRPYLRFSADCSHGVSLPRLADDLLHHVMGLGRGGGPVFSAQRTQPRVGDRAAVNWLQLTAISVLLDFHAPTFALRC